VYVKITLGGVCLVNWLQYNCWSFIFALSWGEGGGNYGFFADFFSPENWYWQKCGLKLNLLYYCVCLSRDNDQIVREGFYNIVSIPNNIDILKSSNEHWLDDFYYCFCFLFRFQNSRFNCFIQKCLYRDHHSST
jgi:hypothetical protein